MSVEKKNQDYTAQSIKVLEGLEGVRKRPAMYIGGVGINGLHHLVYEIVDNSVDEALAGHCTNIEVILHNDGSCSVQDNGRGIPTDMHEGEGISAAEVVLTKLHAGGKFSKDSYKFSGGLHGVGVSVVNALSSHLQLVICRDGKKFEQEYAQGKPLYALKQIGKSAERGTFVKFVPDAEIFSTTEFNFDVLASRFREIAFLNKGLTIKIISYISNQELVFFFEGGISSFIEHINQKKTVLFPQVISMAKSDDNYVLDFAFQYNDSYQEQSYSFVNNIRTGEGGTHEAGFKSALTKVCNKYVQLYNMSKEESLSSDDVREGLVSVLSIKVPEPQFEGQTKNKLGNAEVKGIVDSWIYSFLDIFFEENPAICKIILQKGILAQQARLAAKKAREISRKKNIFEYSVLPGKLADCSEMDPASTELYLVEGESAGGTAKQARDRFTQAILPLRGKILNVEKTTIARALGNNEIKDLITAIGAGIGETDFNPDKVRYQKIVIMTDADVDGAHIRILLLTFFFRYMKPLIEKGFLYIAQPPLYKAKVGKHEQYLKDEFSLKEFIFNWIKKNISISFTADAQSVSAAEIEVFLEKLKVYEKEILEVSNKVEIPANLIQELTKFIFTNDEVISEENLSSFCEKVNENCSFKLITKEEEDKKDFIFLVENEKEFKLCKGFLINELLILLAHYKEIHKFDQEMLISLIDKDAHEISKGLLDASNKLIKLGKSILSLQRYKGLGEMNAEQLWETTMDPKVRVLLQVTIDDAIYADASFSALMGDDVEPRRDYIEKHALFVRNLDA